MDVINAMPNCLRRCGIIPGNCTLSRDQLEAWLHFLTVVNPDAADALAARQLGKPYVPCFETRGLDVCHIYNDLRARSHPLPTSPSAEVSRSVLAAYVIFIDL